MDELVKQITAQLQKVERLTREARKASKAADMAVKELHAMLEKAACDHGPDLGVSPSVVAPKEPPQ